MLDGEYFKEWDEETGNFYYGARYYDPKISVWLSVDPLAHKFPELSPFNFTLNNPINLVDPDGNAPTWPWGVTFIFFELDVGGGAGVGFNYVRQAGVARDQVGRTHFLAGSRGVVNPVESKRTETIGGVSASVTVNARYSWKRETFLGMLSDEGWTITGDFGEGLGVTAGFGDSEVTLGAGIGAGYRLCINSTEILESISLTYNEADAVNDQTMGPKTWGVTNIRKSDDGNFFIGNVTVGIGKNMVVTDQIVRSDADQKVWMSQDYIDSATKVEDL